MNDYINKVVSTFKSNANEENATQMARYMKNNFPFLGTRSPERKTLSRPFLMKKSLPPYHLLFQYCDHLWSLPEREYQYFALTLAQKYTAQFDKQAIDQLEKLAVSKSWWDTVDFIAPNLMGPYFKLHSSTAEQKCEEWLASNNIWLQRCALLFQLKYKASTNAALLFRNIEALTGNRNFFINKAIGWSLRQYAKTNLKEVDNFVTKNEKTLAPLSVREATRHF